MLTVESVSKRIQEKLNIYIPKEILKDRKGDRGKMLQYITGRVAADILNYAFDYNWSWEIKKFWKEESEPLFLDNDKNHENPIPQGPVIHCLGTLTVQFQNEKGEQIKISKDGFGAKTVVGSQSKQEDNYKAASTDALKKAATLFGVAAQLYRDNNEEAFFDFLNDPWNDDEIYMQYQSERKFLREFLKSHENEPDIINKNLEEWSGGRFKDIQELKPKAFRCFVDFLKMKIDGLEEIKNRKEQKESGNVNE